MIQRKLPYIMGHYRADVAVYGLWNEGSPFPGKGSIIERPYTEFDRAIDELVDTLEITKRISDSAEVPDNLMQLLHDFEKKYVVFNEDGTIRRVLWFDKTQKVVDMTNVKS